MCGIDLSTLEERRGLWRGVRGPTSTARGTNVATFGGMATFGGILLFLLYHSSLELSDTNIFES